MKWLKKARELWSGYIIYGCEKLFKAFLVRTACFLFVYSYSHRRCRVPSPPFLFCLVMVVFHPLCSRIGRICWWQLPCFLKGFIILAHRAATAPLLAQKTYSGGDLLQPTVMQGQKFNWKHDERTMSILLSQPAAGTKATYNVFKSVFFFHNFCC